MFDNIRNNIKSYFSSPDLPGNNFTAPLRSHYNFFAKKIKESSDWKGKLIWGTTQVITGAIASPILLGGLGIGAFLNFKPSFEILKHNQDEKDRCIRNIKIQHSMAKIGQIEDCAKEVHHSPEGFTYEIASDVKFSLKSDNIDQNAEELLRKEIHSMMKVNGIFSRHYLLSNVIDEDQGQWIVEDEFLKKNRYKEDL